MRPARRDCRGLAGDAAATAGRSPARRQSGLRSRRSAAVAGASTVRPDGSVREPILGPARHSARRDRRRCRERVLRSGVGEARARSRGLVPMAHRSGRRQSGSLFFYALCRLLARQGAPDSSAASRSTRWLRSVRFQAGPPGPTPLPRAAGREKRLASGHGPRQGSGARRGSSRSASARRSF